MEENHSDIVVFPENIFISVLLSYKGTGDQLWQGCWLVQKSEGDLWLVNNKEEL